MTSRTKTQSEQDWRAMMSSLEAAKNPRHVNDNGATNLVNALVFAARCSASDHPKWVDAQTATTELVQHLGGLLANASRAEIVDTVDYIVMIAELGVDERVIGETL